MANVCPLRIRLNVVFIVTYAVSFVVAASIVLTPASVVKLVSNFEPNVVNVEL